MQIYPNWFKLVSFGTVYSKTTDRNIYKQVVSGTQNNIENKNDHSEILAGQFEGKYQDESEGLQLELTQKEARTKHVILLSGKQELC